MQLNYYFSICMTIKHRLITSNVTSIIKDWSANAGLFAGTWCPLVSVITTIYYIAIIFHRRVWYLHAFSVLCVYSKFGHHPHILGYLCAKFCFFCSHHRWASPWRKTAYSITHSPSLFDARELKHLHFGITLFLFNSLLCNAKKKNVVKTRLSRVKHFIIH